MDYIRESCRRCRKVKENGGVGAGEGEKSVARGSMSLPGSEPISNSATDGAISAVDGAGAAAVAQRGTDAPSEGSDAACSGDLTRRDSAAAIIEKTYRGFDARKKRRKRRATLTFGVLAEYANWRILMDPQTECAYFYNTENGEVTWTVPAIFKVGRGLQILEGIVPAWSRLYSPIHRAYYYHNHVLGISQWEAPESISHTHGGHMLLTDHVGRTVAGPL